MHEEPTVRGLIKSLAGSVFSSLRHNKLAAILSGLACVAVTFLAITIQHDERPRYRESVLPPIARAENEFVKILERADNASTELWRLQYFLNAHRKVKEILRITADFSPTTPDGIEAHRELVRYYSLVNEDMAIIRTEMSLNENLDYLAEWKRYQTRLSPIREKWLTWVNGTGTP